MVADARRVPRLSGGAPLLVTACGGLLTALVVTFWAAVPEAQPQTYTGYVKCGGSECHTKSGEIEWLTDKVGGKGHRNAFNKLRSSASADKVEKYAKAVGLEKYDDRKGMCVKCHGTDVGGTIEGVGCEGCHGAGGGYRDYHSKQPKDYDGAVARGMRNLRKRPAIWIPVCRDCHVLEGRTEYQALLKARHPKGDEWTPEEEYKNVSTHWKKAMYTPEVIAAAASGKPGAGTPAPPSPPTNPPPSPPPNNPPPTPPSGPERAPNVGTSTSRGTSSESGTSILKKKGVNTPLPPQGPGVIVPPPPPTPSGAGAAVTPPAVSTGAMSPLALTMPTPLTSVGAAAVLYDRIAQLLEKLLRSNTVTKTPITPLASPPQVPGPDAQLLRLQSEALALAVEALNLRPAQASSPTPKPPER